MPQPRHEPTVAQGLERPRLGEVDDDGIVIVVSNQERDNTASARRGSPGNTDVADDDETERATRTR